MKNKNIQFMIEIYMSNEIYTFEMKYEALDSEKMTKLTENLYKIHEIYSILIGEDSLYAWEDCCVTCFVNPEEFEEYEGYDFYGETPEEYISNVMIDIDEENKKYIEENKKQILENLTLYQNTLFECMDRIQQRDGKMTIEKAIYENTQFGYTDEIQQRDIKLIPNSANIE